MQQIFHLNNETVNDLQTTPKIKCRKYFEVVRITVCYNTNIKTKVDFAEYIQRIYYSVHQTKLNINNNFLKKV